MYLGCDLTATFKSAVIMYDQQFCFFTVYVTSTTQTFIYIEIKE